MTDISWLDEVVLEIVVKKTIGSYFSSSGSDCLTMVHWGSYWTMKLIGKHLSGSLKTYFDDQLNLSRCYCHFFLGLFLNFDSIEFCGFEFVVKYFVIRGACFSPL